MHIPTPTYICERGLTFFFLVLNDRLTDREYLVGPGKGKYGLADINAFPWVRSWRWAGVDSLDEFPNVAVWDSFF